MDCRKEWSEKKGSKHGEEYSDDCREKYKTCKKEKHEECDCCCTTGIFRKLKSLITSVNSISILVKGASMDDAIIGVVESVNCDTVTLRAGRDTRITISLCEIVAVAETEPRIASEIPEELLNAFSKKK
ncbi:hypothetical protein [Bacillus sp. C1]